MPHRDGKKSRGTHTTCNDLAGKVHDIAARIQEVTGVALGILQNGTGASGGSQRVKIGDMKGGLLLTVRQSSSVQEVRIYSTNVQTTRLALARALRDADIPIAFRR